MEQQIKKKPPQQQSTKRYEYQVCQIESAGCIQKYGMYVSQPWKYAGTHILLLCGMILHYYATFGYLHVALGVINIILHILSTISLIVLAFTDPGMIPKILPSYQKSGYRKIPTNYYRYSSLLKYYQKHYWTVIKGHNLQLKFCNTCYIYRPPRTVHCDQCGICVEKFDHHCPWIGTCVAKRNYKFFLFFLGVLSLLTLKLFTQSIVVSVQHAEWSGAEVIAKSVINIFLCIYIFPAMGFAVFMFFLHLKFAATNVTTNQFCKQTWETLQGNPFKKDSWLKNILKIISLHYQGKINLQERVYQRGDNAFLQNDSITSLNDTKEVNNTVDNLNLNNVNEFKSKTHQNYSTNDHHQIENHEQNHHNPHKQKYSSSKELPDQNKKSLNEDQPHKQSLQPQHQEMSTFDQPISIYDIGLRLHPTSKQVKYKSQESKSYKSNGSQGSSQSDLQKPGTSLQSEKDRSQYRGEELQRQDQVNLKVITEENQTEHVHQSGTKNVHQLQKDIYSPTSIKNQFSIVKMDQSESSQMGSKIIGISPKINLPQKNIQMANINQNDKNHEGNENKERPLQPQKFISLGNQRKNKLKLENQSSEPKFL